MASLIDAHVTIRIDDEDEPDVDEKIPIHLSEAGNDEEESKDEPMNEPSDDDDNEAGVNDDNDEKESKDDIALPELLPEIWCQIFTHLHRRDLNAIGVLSELFWRLARETLWRKPEFKKSLTLDELEEIASTQPPIRHLLLMQFTKEAVGSDDAVERLVDILTSRFHLTAFSIVGFFSLQVDQLACLLSLPVDVLYTGCVSRAVPTVDVVEYLVGRASNPDICIDSGFCYRMKLDSLQLLHKLPVAEIHAGFLSLAGDVIEAEDYDIHFSRICHPFFQLSIHNSISPESLRSFKKTRIHQLYFQAFDLGRSMREYADALDSCDQRPSLVLASGRFHAISLDDFKLLSRKYPIERLHTRLLDITVDNASEFVDLIQATHAQEPYNKFTLDAEQREDFLTDDHVSQLTAARLVTMMEREEYRLPPGTVELGHC